jgi:hypothetical protein
VGFINPKKSSILHERFYQTQTKQDKKTKIECSFQNKNKTYYIMHWLYWVCNFVLKIAYNGFRAMKNILE